MSKKKKLKTEEDILLSISDPNAKAMWGRTRAQTFRDKTKYNRKDHSWADEEKWK